MGVVEDAGKIAGALRAKADAVKTDTANAVRKPVDGTPNPAPVKDSGKRYGDKPGEKRPEKMNLQEALKPLGSFKKGTDYVPKTGMYKLHEGEAVKTKEENTMNASDAMAGLKSKAKPAKKIHKIVTHKTDDGKMIHTHMHHHPNHHPDETHVSNNMDEMAAHMAQHMPNMEPQSPAMPEAAPEGAAPAGM